MYEIRLKESGKLLECTNRKLIKETNKTDILTFTLYPLSKNFINLEEYVTDIIVMDYEKDSIVFDGQVINIDESMDGEGTFIKEVTCLSKLDYLDRVVTGKWDIHPEEYTPESTTETTEPYEIYTNMNVQKYLKLILDHYNARVKEDKKILLGNVTIDENVTCSCDRESVLTEIQTLATNKDAFIILREENEMLYLDFLSEINETGPRIEKGINIESINRDNTLEKPVTRLIPIGKDGLTIKSVNNNIEYIENATLISKYGIIEEVNKWDDVTIASNLLSKAKKYFESVNNKNYSISVSALDLSYINLNFDRFKLNQACDIYVDVLGIFETHMIRKITIDLDNPQESTLEFNNSSLSLINNTIKQKKQLSNSIKSLNKSAYDVGGFKITTEENISNINNTVDKERVYRIMGVY